MFNEPLTIAVVASIATFCTPIIVFAVKTSWNTSKVLTILTSNQDKFEDKLASHEARLNKHEKKLEEHTNLLIKHDTILQHKDLN